MSKTKPNQETQGPVSTEPILEVKGCNGDSLLRVDNTGGKIEGGIINTETTTITAPQEPVSTTAPQGVDIAVIVAQVCENATFKLIQDRLTKIEQSFRDLDSRICEIENFRNTSSIEGKIRDISEKYDEVLQIVGGLKAKLK